MATNRLTDEQRAGFLSDLSYSNAVRFAERVFDHFPAVADDVAAWLNPCDARPFNDIERISLIVKSGPDDLSRFMDWVRTNHPDVFDEAFKRIGRVEDLEALGLLQKGAVA